MNEKKLVQFAFRTQPEKKEVVKVISEKAKLDMGSIMNLISDQALYDLDLKIFKVDFGFKSAMQIDGVYEYLREMNLEQIKKLEIEFTQNNHILREGYISSGVSPKVVDGKVLLSKKELYNYLMNSAKRLYPEFVAVRNIFIANETVIKMVGEEEYYEFKRYSLEEMKGVEHIDVYYNEIYSMEEDDNLEEEDYDKEGNTGTYRISEIEVHYKSGGRDDIFYLDCQSTIFENEFKLERAVEEDLGDYGYKINFHEMM